MENHSIVIPTKDKLFNLDPLLRRTPGNILTWIILTVGLIITIIRFTQGIGSVTTWTTISPGACGSAMTCSAACAWPPAATSPPWPATSWA